MEEGPEAQAKAVEAVFFHEQDYPDASMEERKEFHHLCGMWCKFKVWEEQGKPLEGFKRIKKDLQGNEVVWEGGLIAKFRIEHPDAYNELHDIFKTLGCLELMKRCGKKSQIESRRARCQSCTVHAPSQSPLPTVSPPA